MACHARHAWHARGLDFVTFGMFFFFFPGHIPTPNGHTNIPKVPRWQTEQYLQMKKKTFKP
jgi:hypothetical protein